MADLQSLTINDTGFLGLPSGTTAQRPASPSVGHTRFNTSSKAVESYTGSIWIPVTSFPYVSTDSAATLNFTFGPADVKGESDSLTACSGLLTFQQALSFVHSINARLPTVDEVERAVSAGSGCGYDNTQIWTVDSSDSGATSHYTIFGRIETNGNASIDTLDTSTAYVRYCADVDINRGDPIMLRDAAVYGYLYP